MNLTRTAPDAYLAPKLGAVWFLLVAGTVFAGPSLVELARQVWTTTQGAQGPIILATGLWLLVEEGRSAWPARRQGKPWLTAAALAPLFVSYVFAKIVGMLWLEWLSAYLALVATFYRYAGDRVVQQLWFPLGYLLFLVPPPNSIIAPATRALALSISSAAVEILAWFGFQVASSGTTIDIDQYEVLVAEACSGMNSIVSLLAIGLFYIFLMHRAEWRYALALAALVIPIAVLANLARVLILLLAAHYLGIGAVESLLHEAAGLIMFFVALAVLIGFDRLLTPVRRRLSAQRAW